MKRPIALAIHGGAGALAPHSYSSEEYQEYRNALKTILKKGIGLLRQGGSSYQVVLELTRVFEDHPLFNAGRGSVFNSEGINEMDASIMDGRTLQGAGVTCVKKTKNPILLADLISNNTHHTLIAGDFAEKLGAASGLIQERPEYFRVEKRFSQYKNFIKTGKSVLDHGGGSTVGAVALDLQGNLAAATSTGGMTGKLPGRVSDSSILGAGTYANNKSCAVSGTGTGDKFITGSLAFQVHSRIEFGGEKLQEACDKTLEHLKQLGGEGGFIAIDAEGNLSTPFNSLGMFRGSYSDRNPCASIGIYHEDEPIEIN